MLFSYLLSSCSWRGSPSWLIRSGVFDCPPRLSQNLTDWRELFFFQPGVWTCLTYFFICLHICDIYVYDLWHIDIYKLRLITCYLTFMKKCSVFHIILQKSGIFDSGLAPLLQQSSWYFGSSHRRWSVRSSRCVKWASWRTGWALEGDIPGLGRMEEDSQGSMVPGRPSVVFTGRLCTDSCSRSSINYGGCDTGGRNWADLKTHVDQPGAGWNQLLSLQVKSALISAIDYGLIKTSYDYAAIESTLVPTMALLLDRINGMISWYHDISVPTYTPDMQKKNYAKDQEAANIHQNPALRKPYVHSFDMVFTDRTAGLKISHREEEWTSGKVKQSTFEMGEVDTNFLSTKLRIFMEETLDSHRLRCCS